MFKKILDKFRKHSFDLNNPIITSFDTNDKYYIFKSYECVNCGKRLSLFEWQMRDLPFFMARGCNNYNKKRGITNG